LVVLPLADRAGRQWPDYWILVYFVAGVVAWLALRILGERLPVEVAAGVVIASLIVYDTTRRHWW